MTKGNGKVTLLAAAAFMLRRGARTGIRRSWLVVMAAVLVVGMTSVASADTASRAAFIPSAGVASPVHFSGTVKECFYTYPDCASSDPTAAFRITSNGDTTGCTFDLTVDWGDGNSSYQFNVPGGPDGSTLAHSEHTYTYPDPFVDPDTYYIDWSFDVVTGSTCGSNSGAPEFTRTCTAAELSGAAWAKQFPGSTEISKLAQPFQQDVRDFIDAMHAAQPAPGIHVHVVSTLRPPERAYMMHWSWMIAKGEISAEDVPAFVPESGQAPVNVCWEHTDANGVYDPSTSITAAQDMATALGVVNLPIAPALNSNHTKGLAIDMTTTWSASSISIVESIFDGGSGQSVPINTTPHNGQNSQLIAVGATYGVIHLQPAAHDPNHWSWNGR
jgi:hypothetical protein